MTFNEILSLISGLLVGLTFGYIIAILRDRKSKTEVERELFNEIEKQSIYNAAKRMYGISELTLVKLKNKYIGEKRDDNRTNNNDS